MNINFISFYTCALPSFKEKILPLTGLQKKILIIASIAFGLLVSYVANIYCLRVISKIEPKRSDKHDIQKKPEAKTEIIDEEEKEKIIPKDQQKINECKESLEKDQQEVNSFTNLPDEMLMHIFSKLEAKDWSAISQTDRCFQSLSKSPEVIASLLEDKRLYIPLNKRLELAKLAGCSLKKLNLQRTEVNDEQLEEIFKVCPNIKKLNLSDTNVSNATISKLPTGLISLQLKNCNELTAIDHLPLGLKSLNLSSNYPNLKDLGLDRLPEGFLSINLSYCSDLTDADIKKLPKGLQILNLTSCYKLTDAAIENLPPSLLSLNLHQCPISEAALAKLPQKLQSLNLSHRSILSDATIKTLPQSLLSLDLTGCESLTEAAIDHLPQGLKSLDLSYCDQLRHKIFDRLPPGIESLGLSWFSLTDEAIDKIPKGLKSLDLSYCFDLTTAILDKLPQNLRFLNLLDCDEDLINAAIAKFPETIVHHFQ
jgi:hypothetical protein